MWLFVALIVVPLIEIGLFIEVGGLIGLWPTLATVVLTAILGAVLLRRQGLAALTELRTRLDQGRDPTGVLAHGALILVAGVVLLTPGFFTDAVGFALLVPAVRTAVIRSLGRRIVVAVQTRQGRAGATPGTGATGAGSGAAGQSARGTVIEGEWQEAAPPAPDGSGGGNSGWTRPPEG